MHGPAGVGSRPNDDRHATDSIASLRPVRRTRHDLVFAIADHGSLGNSPSAKCKTSFANLS